eukprot:2159348-Rhodomonas_salina.1
MKAKNTMMAARNEPAPKTETQDGTAVSGNPRRYRHVSNTQDGTATSGKPKMVPPCQENPRRYRHVRKTQDGTAMSGKPKMICTADGGGEEAEDSEHSGFNAIRSLALSFGVE